MIKARQFPSAESLTDEIVHLIGLRLGEPHAIMLAGGSTPMEAYKRIAQQPPHASDNARVLFSDDRHVPPDDPRSNFGSIRAMLDALQIPPDRVLRVQGEKSLEDATKLYDEALGQLVVRHGRVTLGLLGLGADGHTASLFSREDIERASGRWALSVRRPDGMNGVSATPDFIARVERIVFVVCGKEKRVMARTLLMDSLSIPAGLAVRNNQAVELWTDPEASPFD